MTPRFFRERAALPELRTVVREDRTLVTQPFHRRSRLVIGTHLLVTAGES
jgi:hypothetical protein